MKKNIFLVARPLRGGGGKALVAGNFFFGFPYPATTLLLYPAGFSAGVAMNLSVYMLSYSNQLVTGATEIEVDSFKQCCRV